MRPGDLVLGAFPGAEVAKIRPAVVLSSETYHQCHPYVIVELITTQTPKALTPIDCELHDWRGAGLRQPSIFRLFAATLLQREVHLIGRLSGPDWAAVRACCEPGFRAD